MSAKPGTSTHTRLERTGGKDARRKQRESRRLQQLAKQDLMRKFIERTTKPAKDDHDD